MIPKKVVLRKRFELLRVLSDLSLNKSHTRTKPNTVIGRRGWTNMTRTRLTIRCIIKKCTKVYYIWIFSPQGPEVLADVARGPKQRADPRQTQVLSRRVQLRLRGGFRVG